ncbi:MAG: hypothetical protein GX493_12155 [Firmicutes bacterium]|nr:hypothetical protein [Bacillota bacterium]
MTRDQKAVKEVLLNYNLAKARLSVLNRLITEARDVRGGHDVIQIGDGGGHADPTADKAARVEELRREAEDLQRLVRAVELALEILSPEERRVIEGRFLSSPPARIEDLADRLFCSRNKIYRLQDSAFERMAYVLFGRQKPR